MVRDRALRHTDQLNRERHSAASKHGRPDLQEIPRCFGPEQAAADAIAAPGTG